MDPPSAPRTGWGDDSAAETVEAGPRWDLAGLMGVSWLAVACLYVGLTAGLGARYGQVTDVMTGIAGLAATLTILSYTLSFPAQVRILNSGIERRTRRGVHFIQWSRLLPIPRDQIVPGAVRFLFRTEHQGRQTLDWFYMSARQARAVTSHPNYCRNLGGG